MSITEQKQATDGQETQARLYLWIMHQPPAKLEHHFAHDTSPPIISWPQIMFVRYFESFAQHNQ